jgi:hypothetical protein
VRIDADAAVGNNRKRPAATSFIDISKSRHLDNSLVRSIQRHHTNLSEYREAPVEHLTSRRQHPPKIWASNAAKLDSWVCKMHQCNQTM